ncbi:MAG: CsbD family protein [Terriglobales bacterium]
MNWDRIEGQWKQMKGSVKERWGKLTDDDLNVIGGRKDQLVGRVQERYGIAKDEAQRQVDEWNKTLAEQNQEEVDNRFNRKAS